ncbi:MAG: HipA domain-containing protein [Pseudomonadota bacterium]
MEYLSNQIAQSLGIPVAWFNLLNYCGLRTFVTKNFISESKVASTLTHLNHYFSENEPYQYESIIAIIYKQTGKFKDVETFINMCLFDALIGNHDRHGRNVGLINTSRQCKLAPIYDNPSYLGLESGSMLRAQFSPSGRIETFHNRNPVMKDYVMEFLRLGYESTLRRFAKRINLDIISGLVTGSSCSPSMKDAMLKLIRERAEEMRHALL